VCGGAIYFGRRQICFQLKLVTWAGTTKDTVLPDESIHMGAGMVLDNPGAVYPTPDAAAAAGSSQPVVHPGKTGAPHQSGTRGAHP